MANEQRGEVELKLGDETYTLRPTFEAMCAIEAALGYGILEVINRMKDQKFGVRDAMVIIACVSSEKRGASVERKIGESLMQTNLPLVWANLLNFLVQAISGPDADKKK